MQEGSTSMAGHKENKEPKKPAGIQAASSSYQSCMAATGAVNDNSLATGGSIFCSRQIASSVSLGAKVQRMTWFNPLYGAESSGSEAVATSSGSPSPGYIAPPPMPASAHSTRTVAVLHSIPTAGTAARVPQNPDHHHVQKHHGVQKLMLTSWRWLQKHSSPIAAAFLQLCVCAFICRAFTGVRN